MLARWISIGLCLLLPFLSFAQVYHWIGQTGSVDFFDRGNWKDTLTGDSPSPSELAPNQAIDITLLLRCDAVSSFPIEFGLGSLKLVDGSLEAPMIKGGTVELAENAYLTLTDTDPLRNGVIVNFESALSWLKLPYVYPSLVFTRDLISIRSSQATVQYPQTVRIDNYYSQGAVVRLEDTLAVPLVGYASKSLNGATTDFVIDKVHQDVAGTWQTKSFFLKRGYMATIAEHPDGTGVGKVFIAAEQDLVLDSLPAKFNGKCAFIRVLPWNWLAKRGVGGLDTGMNNTWFYNWNRNQTSSLDNTYTPMAWGYGSGDDTNDIIQYREFYKANHLLGFNEPDNCNGASGQYKDLCIPDTAVMIYKNLMSTGLRMVSPSCREGAWDTWLHDFDSIAQKQGVRMDVIAIHWYDWGSSLNPNGNPANIFNRFKNYLEKVHNKYGLPIWITEFNANRNRTTAVNDSFLRLATTYLDTLSYVERYAWFEPITKVSNYYDTLGNITPTGLMYRDIRSKPAVPDSIWGGKSSMDMNMAGSVYRPSCPVFTVSPPLKETVIREMEHLWSVNPNPSKGSFYIHFKGFEQVQSVQIRLLDINGRIIGEAQAIVGPDQLYESHLLRQQAAGLYLLQLQFEGGKLYYQKLIRQ